MEALIDVAYVAVLGLILQRARILAVVSVGNDYSVFSLCHVLYN